MSRIASAISQSPSWGAQRAQRVEHVITVINTTRVRLLCLAVIAVLGVAYLWLVSSAATSGFYLSDLETKRVALDEEYRKLEVEQTALRSLDHIQEQSAQMQMVASGRVEYPQPDSSVALTGN
jgi:cell division protein FtsL